jgi:hypothetical protein
MNNLKLIKNFNKIYTSKCSKHKIFPSILPAVNRIIVIGDIHGDFNMLVRCLKLAKLIDNKFNWIGGDTVVVQVGDQIDSCRFSPLSNNNCNLIIMDNDNPDDLNILYFMTELHKKASKEGGAVYSLIGNHELLNSLGNLSYVSHNNIRSFDNYKTKSGVIIRDGYQARHFAFTPGNDIANFLACTRKIALVIGSNLFVHGGIVPYIANKYKIEDMNKLLTLFLLGEIEKPEYFTDLFVSGKTSPLWTRLFGMKVNNCENLMTPLKEVYNVNKIYVGHTPQLSKGIHSQCNDSIWMTDIGLSRAFNKFKKPGGNNIKKVQVLEILNDSIINILS